MKNLIVWLTMLLLVLISSQFAYAAVKKSKSPMKSKKAVMKEEVKCPVTGDNVDPATTKLKTVYKGKPYYFCCPGCPEEFAKDPEKYIRQTKK
jgi:YHS domain-containing protein